MLGNLIGKRVFVGRLAPDWRLITLEYLETISWRVLPQLFDQLLTLLDSSFERRIAVLNHLEILFLVPYFVVFRSDHASQVAYARVLATRMGGSFLGIASIDVDAAIFAPQLSTRAL